MGTCFESREDIRLRRHFSVLADEEAVGWEYSEWMECEVFRNAKTPPVLGGVFES
jgi:hypothetical protein